MKVMHSRFAAIRAGCSCSMSLSFTRKVNPHHFGVSNKESKGVDMAIIALSPTRNAADCSPVTRFMGSLRSWAQRKVTRSELYRLSDRELDDIGLCRADIDDLVKSRG